ncbi:MAG: 4Fe-4S binding protein [Thermodesulfobacteriota bacterium]|nr:4Fe-4S binding protein [Thermodesulfobacteriota bacterium]
MAKGEIVIAENMCKGCSCCVELCPNDCLVMSDQFNPRGYFYPVFINEDNCTGCAICGLLCPDLAIEVYRITED